MEHRPRLFLYFPLVALLALVGCLDVPTRPLSEELGNPTAVPVDIPIIIERVPPYPIHVHYLDEFGDSLRVKIDRAVARWGWLLAGNEPLPFVFERGHENNWDRKLLAFESGDTLPPGLHLYFHLGPEGTGSAAIGSRGLLHPVKNTPPFGRIRLSRLLQHGSANVFSQLRAESVVVHEIGHVVGIGSGPRWSKHREKVDSLNYLNDPEVIAAFDRLTGGKYPGRKVPLDRLGVHFHPCIGMTDSTFTASMGTASISSTNDVMASAGHIVTELTLSAMQGFTYYRGHAETKLLPDQLSWSRCPPWIVDDGTVGIRLRYGIVRNWATLEQGASAGTASAFEFADTYPGLNLVGESDDTTVVSFSVYESSTNSWGANITALSVGRAKITITGTASGYQPGTDTMTVTVIGK